MFYVFLLAVAYLFWKQRSQLKGIWGFIWGGYFLPLQAVACLDDWAQEIPLPIKTLIAIGVMFGQWKFLRRYKKATETTAQRTVLFFLLGSTLSAFIQWLTESQRTVSAMTYSGVVTYCGEKFDDTWFTAVSAICVTGLTSTNFAAYSLIGQLVTLITILAGGMGVVFLMAFVGMLVKAGLSTRDGMDALLQDSTNTVSPEQAKKLAWQIIQMFAFFIGGGTLLIGGYYQWFGNQALLNGANPWYWGSFHSISAFCNAGFGLNENNLMNFQEDPVVNGVIGWLIILGGLGFPVLLRCKLFIKWLWYGVEAREEIESLEAVEASRVQTEVCLKGTLLLLVLSTLLTLLLEYKTLPGDFLEKLMAALSQAIYARTAGFNTVALSEWKLITQMLYCVLMFICACPAGTGGGIKIPTVKLIIAWFTPREGGTSVPIHSRGEVLLVDRNTMPEALKTFIGAILTVVVAILLLLFFEPEGEFMKKTFEVFSAFGTVGLSLGIPDWMTSWSGKASIDSKVVLDMVMLIGRVGPLMAFFHIVNWGKTHTKDEEKDMKRTRLQVG